MDCKNCVKEDACKQKELLNKVKEMIDNLEIYEGTGNSIMVIPKRSLKTIYGIEVEVSCSRAVKKQMEFSPGWTNADIKMNRRK